MESNVVIYQTRQIVHHHISKHREESCENATRGVVFDKLRGFWKCG